MADFVCTHQYWLKHRRGLQERAGQEAEPANRPASRSMTMRRSTSGRRTAPVAPPAAPILAATRAHARTSRACARSTTSSFSIAPGEIVALLGQNGAGKSTLIQIFAGAHPRAATTATISFAGRPYRPAGVAEAEAAGVALVPQEVNVVPDLTRRREHLPQRRADALGHDRRRRAAAPRRARRWPTSASTSTRPCRWASLDLATQQLVVIARALAKKARLLILDEPTAALTENESLRLFERMRALKARGVAIIFVSHRLAEVFAIADRIVVMRDGRIRGRPSRSATYRAHDDRRRDDRRRRRAAGAPSRTGTLGDVALEVARPERLRRRRPDAGRRPRPRRPQGRDRRPVRAARGGLHRGGARGLRRLARPARGRHPGRRRSRRDRQPRCRGGARARADGAGPPRLPDRRAVGRRQHRHRQPAADRAPRACSTSPPAGGARSTRSTR